MEISEGKDARKTISGDNFDILYVNLPQDMVNVNHEYKLDPQGPGGRVTILRISRDALVSFVRGRRYHALVQQLRERMTQQMLFDVFISYALRILTVPSTGAKPLRRTMILQSMQRRTLPRIPPKIRSGRLKSI